LQGSSTNTHVDMDTNENLVNGFVDIPNPFKGPRNDGDSRTKPGVSTKRRHESETDQNRDKALCDVAKGATGNSSKVTNRVGKVFSVTYPPTNCQEVFAQLCKIGYLSDTPGVRNVSQNMIQDYFEVDSILIPSFDSFNQAFMSFSELTMQRYLVNAVTVLNQTHIRCLQTFIICAFDMARDVLVTPKKIEFAREKEDGLFKSLYQIAVDKGDEIREMIEQTIADSRESLMAKAYEYDFIGRSEYISVYIILTHYIYTYQIVFIKI